MSTITEPTSTRSTLTADDLRGGKVPTQHTAATLDNRVRAAGEALSSSIGAAHRSTIATWLDAGAMALELVGDAVADSGGGKRFASAKDARQWVYHELAGAIQSGTGAVQSGTKSRKALAGLLRDWSAVSTIADAIGRDLVESTDMACVRALAKCVKWDAKAAIYSRLPDGRAQALRSLLSRAKNLGRSGFRESLNALIDPSKAQEAAEVAAARQQLADIEARTDVPDDVKQLLVDQVRARYPAIDDLAGARRKAKRAAKILATIIADHGREAAESVVLELVQQLAEDQATQSQE